MKPLDRNIQRQSWFSFLFSFLGYVLKFIFTAHNTTKETPKTAYIVSQACRLLDCERIYLKMFFLMFYLKS